MRAFRAGLVVSRCSKAQQGTARGSTVKVGALACLPARRSPWNSARSISRRSIGLHQCVVTEGGERAHACHYPARQMLLSPNRQQARRQLAKPARREGTRGGQERAAQVSRPGGLPVARSVDGDGACQVWRSAIQDFSHVGSYQLTQFPASAAVPAWRAVLAVQRCSGSCHRLP